jgi:predicted transcriptional regulator
MNWGRQKEIAKICGCTWSHVSGVLNGYRNQENAMSINIIRLAEKFAKRDRQAMLRELELESIRKEHRNRYKMALRN